jgi:hypothetical protein
MEKRGWDDNLLNRTLSDPFHTSEAVNKKTQGRATAYFLKDGSYVVRDDVTKSIVQVSDRHNPGWIPDVTIRKPYRPRR